MSLPRHWFNNPETKDDQALFLSRLRASARPVLICDYDGTLAPFMADKMRAVPYPGVTERLEQLHAGRTRLVFVSGRPVAELLQLAPLAADLELWGSHGREHRTPDGSYEIFTAGKEQLRVLDQVEAALIGAGYGAETERKSGSIAVHWRNLDSPGALRLEQRAQAIFNEYAAVHADHGGFSVMPFESGVELRVADRTKADAIEAVLAGATPDTAAAYLGDDTTDEDAFGALGRRGLSVLVRAELRDSLASAWLQPPDELLRFFDEWLEAVETEEHER